MRALRRSRQVAVLALAVLPAMLALLVAHRLQPSAVSKHVSSKAVEISLASPDFGPSLRRPVTAVRAHDTAPLPADVRCRWVYAHADVGFESTSANGCSAELYIDPARTRLSRFEHDRWMSLDVIVTRDGDRVGFASTKLRYVD